MARAAAAGFWSRVRASARTVRCCLGGLAAVMVMCAFEIQAGTKTVGDFVLINAMMIQLYQPLNFMGMVYREIKQAITDIEIMFSILGRQAEIQDVSGAPPLTVSTGIIRFENVSFAYEPSRPILKGISFEVPAGKTVAVVGPSGAGKSTLSRLLFRFYDLSGGRILIDRRELSEYELSSLRRRISKRDCQAVSGKTAPAGTKGLSGWLRVSVYQIASLSLRASSICAIFGPRWRPKRRRVRWHGACRAGRT